MLIRKCNPSLLSDLKLFKNKNYVLFTPKKLGIMTNKLSILYFLQSYNNLEIDIKNKNGFPTRLRRYANYNVDINDNDFEIIYTGKNTFKQDVPDSRMVERKFELIENKYIRDNFILNLIEKSTILTILNSENKINKLDISLHQIRQICYPNVDSHNSPEGIHRDGADYIISALVMNRSNIDGGESIIYDKDKNIVFNKILYPKEGIFQEDKNLWHYVTPIKSKGEYIGYRDILGIDIKVIS